MASKERLKKHGRNIYLKDATLWDRIQDKATEKDWSINQVVEKALAKEYPKPVDTDQTIQSAEASEL